MPDIILSDTSASVSELKKNPMATVNAKDGYSVAILNQNQPASTVCLLNSTKGCLMLWMTRNW